MPIRKRKWFIPVVVASVLLIGGITGGMIAAADNDTSLAAAQNETTNQLETLLDKVCAIYQEQTGVAIDPQQLKDALQQAQKEMRDEALQGRLQDLVDQGKLTKEQASQFLQWWQSRPDIQLPLAGPERPGGMGGMMRGGLFGAWGGPWCAPDAPGGTSG
jgi:uncharacterized membrane protein